MTVSKTVLIGAVAFAPAAFLHGCGGDDKNKPPAQTGVRPAGGDNGGSKLSSKVEQLKTTGQAALKTVQEEGQQLQKSVPDAEIIGQVKEAIESKNYAEAWKVITEKCRSVANAFAAELGKTKKDLTEDEKKECCDEVAALASAATLSAKKAQKVQPDLPEQQKLASSDPAVFKKVSVADGDAELNEDELDGNNEDMSETYDSLLKEFAAEKKKSVEDLTDNELEEFADILEEHDMDFTDHVNGLEDNEQTKKIAATLKAIAQTEGEDSYHKIVNRIQKKYLADKDEEDLTEEDYAAIVQDLEDHQIDFQKHIKERSQTDPLAKADKTRKFNDIMDGKDLKKSEDREQFVQELDDNSQDFEDNLKVAAEKNIDEEIDMAGLLTDLQNKKAQKVVIAMEELVALEDGEDAVEEVLQGLTDKLYESSRKQSAKDITAEDLSTFFGELEQDVTAELERLIKEGTPEQQEKATLILEALKAEDGGASGSGAESDQGRKRKASGSADETQQDQKRAKLYDVNFEPEQLRQPTPPPPAPVADSGRHPDYRPSKRVRRAQSRQGTLVPTGQ